LTLLLIFILTTFASVNLNIRKLGFNYSGGITIYVRNEDLSIVKKYFDTIIWLKLKAILFNLVQINIYAAYIYGPTILLPLGLQM
jgi:hypothetical protein